MHQTIEVSKLFVRISHLSLHFLKGIPHIRSNRRPIHTSSIYVFALTLDVIYLRKYLNLRFTFSKKAKAMLLAY